MKLFFVLIFALLIDYNYSKSAIITIDTTIKYQTIGGWEAVCYSGETKSPMFKKYINNLIDSVVMIGVNRLRLEIRAGVENTNDYWTQYQNAEILYQTWREHRYTNVNDNDNPDSINWDGFHFSEIDNTIENVVIPYLSAMKEYNKKPFINLNYVAFIAQNAPNTFYIQDNPDEYAEYMLATFLHLKEKFNITPDFLEIILEPDNISKWNGKVIGRAMVATANKLNSSGFYPKFIVPSNTNMANAISYFYDILTIPGASERIDEFAYHRYSGVNATNVDSIGKMSQSFKINTSMLEWWSGANSYKILWDDIARANNSWWQQGTIAGLKAANPATSFFVIDTTDPNNPKIERHKLTKTTSIFYENIPPGSVRIHSNSNKALAKPIAFLTEGGNQVIIVLNDDKTAYSFAGLNLGEYSYTYFTTEGNLSSTGNFSVSSPTTEELFSFDNSGILLIKQISSVGINELNTADFSLYPNPLESDLIIENNGLQGKCFIVNLYGNEVRSFNISSGQPQLKIDLNDLQSGTYFLKFTSEANVIYKKFVIVK